MKSLLINDNVHERIKQVASSLKKNISPTVEEALLEFADKIQYSKEVFDDFINKSPKVKIYSDLLKEEFAVAPNKIYRDILKMRERFPKAEVEFN